MCQMSLTKSLCASFVSFVIFVVGFVRRRLQIAANSNCRRRASMETGPAEILLLRPPASGRKRAQASPQPERHPVARARPRRSSPPRPRPLAATSGSAVVKGLSLDLRSGNWVKCPNVSRQEVMLRIKYLYQYPSNFFSSSESISPNSP